MLAQSNEHNRYKVAKGNWVTYRPEIKVLDCTIRDGGLMNNHNFDEKIVKSIYDTCILAGIDYVELGYKGSKKLFSSDDHGPWKFCDEEDLRRIVGDKNPAIKISVMADAERTDYHTDIIPKEKSVIDMIRIATYIHQIPAALDMIKDAHDKGYETTLNLMSISTVPEREIDDALEAISRSEVGTMYVVDSFGSMYSEQLQPVIRKFMKYALPEKKEVGIHTHNNQMLAYANTIEAVVQGVNRLDATIAGLGRGAGNCPLELLIGFLHNPKFNLRPVLQCIEDHIDALRAKLKWGFDIPYMITGQLNQHPRDAIKFNESEKRGSIVKFFDEMITDD